MTARVIVTRPAREASRWIDALRAEGLDARALPLIAIEPVEDARARAALLRARRDLAEQPADAHPPQVGATHRQAGEQTP